MPRVDGRYASVGTVAKIERPGELPGGLPRLVVRGVRRAVLGAGVPGTGAALWVEAEPVDETERHRPSAVSWHASTAPSSRTSSSSAAPRASPRRSRGIDDPGAIADTAG